MDRTQLAKFLHSRRTSLQPADVGLPSGPRRRTPGLRREEVASLSGMSTDYYARLEQGRGPTPSENVLTSISNGLRLSPRERDHLFELAGRQAPADGAGEEEHISPGLLRVLDLLRDSPAQIVTPLAETLAQTALSVALVGDEMAYEGLDRSLIHRWFTRPEVRRIYPEPDHAAHSREFTTQLRTACSGRSSGSRASLVVDSLLRGSEEFASLWHAYEIEIHHEGYRKRILHPELNLIELDCQLLFRPGQSHGLLIYTAEPDSASHRKIEALSALTSAGPATA